MKYINIILIFLLLAGCKTTEVENKEEKVAPSQSLSKWKVVIKEEFVKSSYFTNFPEYIYIFPPVRIDVKGEPQEKSYMLNLSYIVSIESLTNHEIKITMNNGKIVLIDLGLNNKASIVMDDILDLSAVGSDYNVYNISSVDK